MIGIRVCGLNWARPAAAPADTMQPPFDEIVLVRRLSDTPVPVMLIFSNYEGSPTLNAGQSGASDLDELACTPCRRLGRFSLACDDRRMEPQYPIVEGVEKTLEQRHRDAMLDLILAWAAIDGARWDGCFRGSMASLQWRARG